jgi:hypothetical protein
MTFRQRSRIPAVLTFAIFALGSVVACAAADRADQTRLLALENAWNQAQLQRDARALDALVPDTFVYTDYDGTVMNKADFLADNRDPAYKPTLVTNEDMRVFSYPGAAVVIGKYHTKGIYKGKPFEHWGRFTDTWIYQNNTWQCVASHTNLISK